jgi:ribosomal protein L37AE/L43A
MSEREHPCRMCGDRATVGLSAAGEGFWFCSECFAKVTKEIASGATREKAKREARRRP